MSTDSKPIRILTADDHPVLRYGMSALDGAEPDMELLRELEALVPYRSDVVKRRKAS